MSASALAANCGAASSCAAACAAISCKPAAAMHVKVLRSTACKTQCMAAMDCNPYQTVQRNHNREGLPHRLLGAILLRPLGQLLAARLEVLQVLAQLDVAALKLLEALVGRIQLALHRRMLLGLGLDPASTKPYLNAHSQSVQLALHRRMLLGLCCDPARAFTAKASTCNLGGNA